MKDFSEGASPERIAQGLGLKAKKKRRATHSDDAPPMGVSFHQVARRFEGRESATNNLASDCDFVAEPSLNVAVMKRYP